MKNWHKYITQRTEIQIPEHCAHPRTALRRRTVARGFIQIRHQCLTCGQSRGDAVAARSLPRGQTIDTLEAWDETLAETYRTDRTRLVDQAVAERDGGWRARYGQYLESPEWKAIRGRVLQRDGHMCQGCRIMPATQVHHLSYRNVGREPLFDLTSICDGCHASVHGGDDEEENEDRDQDGDESPAVLSAGKWTEVREAFASRYPLQQYMREVVFVESGPNTLTLGAQPFSFDQLNRPAVLKSLQQMVDEAARGAMKITVRRLPGPREDVAF